MTLVSLDYFPNEIVETLIDMWISDSTQVVILGDYSIWGINKITLASYSCLTFNEKMDMCHDVFITKEDNGNYNKYYFKEEL